jgi:hypothetical protein
MGVFVSKKHKYVGVLTNNPQRIKEQFHDIESNGKLPSVALEERGKHGPYVNAETRGGRSTVGTYG